jgi:uncharacterized membrane protein YjjP (DUF1212 family)
MLKKSRGNLLLLLVGFLSFDHPAVPLVLSFSWKSWRRSATRSLGFPRTKRQKKKTPLPTLEEKNNGNNNAEIVPPKPAIRKRDRLVQRLYNWQDFRPHGGLTAQLQWMVSGKTDRVAKPSEAERRDNIQSLARLILLLREYKTRYGMPRTTGGPQMQKDILADLSKQLYQSGAPTWALEPVMERVAEGLTGKLGVQFSFLPRRAFIFFPAVKGDTVMSGTDMVKTQSGFNMHRLTEVERVAVRLASFASNTQSVERLGAAAFTVPRQIELLQAMTVSPLDSDQGKPQTADSMAKEILDLASESFGLFYFTNTWKFQAAVKALGDADEEQFWQVDREEQELFSRLAATEASTNLAKIRSERRELYGPTITTCLRVGSAVGASAMWFGGSVADMALAAGLTILVGSISKIKALAFEERVLTEVAASFIVGLTAGIACIVKPQTFSFSAVAIPALLDLLQGFKVVYAVIEVLSKNIVAGAPRILEGLLFTGLIVYNMKFGMNTALRLMLGSNHPSPADFAPFLTTTGTGIAKIWYTLLLPLASLSWSGLFLPSYVDLPIMAAHGMLAFLLNAMGVHSFIAAMCLTFCAGIISRFTGRQALGNTVAGLYALVPGVYMVTKMFTSGATGFVEQVVAESVSIGLGAWTGTILCSPTILGKSSGLHGRDVSQTKPGALFFF